MYDANLKEAYFPAQGGAPESCETIGAMLQRQAAMFPDRPALCELDFDGARARQWTYHELLSDATRLAKALASRHKKGARHCGLCE